MEALSDDLMAEVLEAFEACDPNHTGLIRTIDLGTVMRAMGLNYTEAELNGYAEELDDEYEGTIDFQSFVALMTKQFKHCEQKEYLETAFKVFDRDGDGFITYSKLRNMFTSLGEKINDEEFNLVFNEADVDGDGVINLKDFISAYKS